MEEQLITFETAKLAKEKGFDIRVKCSYVKGRLFRRTKRKRDNWNKFDDKYYSAPTQSLLQKWLRETRLVNNYSIVVTVHFTSFSQYWFDINNGKKTGDKFDTYEEALEKGLQEALKLIE